jgi:alkyl hydroperoxide reductase subunit AhpF
VGFVDAEDIAATMTAILSAAEPVKTGLVADRAGGAEL